MRTGYDNAGYGFPGIAAMQNAGMTFAGRYITPDHPRGLQSFELAAFDAAGFDLITYYEEVTGQEILQGYSFGVRAGQVATNALHTLGQYQLVPVFLACDFDIDPGAVEPVFEALQGLSSVIGHQNAGVYGGVVPVHLARIKGYATYGVQAGAWRTYRAPQVGVTDPYGWSPYAQVRQDGYNQYLGGVQIDHLTALAGDFGQWKRPGPVYVIPPDNTPWDPMQFHNRPVLSKGATGGNVEVVQFILNMGMGAKLTVDGVFGESTYQAVYFWQGLAKLPKSGAVTTATWDSFGAYVARVHRFDREPPIQYNDVGHPGAVKDLQNGFNGVVVPGFTPMAVDGAFGPKTRDAVAQYQRNRKLPVDGKVGKQTWSDLGVLLTQRGR